MLNAPHPDDRLHNPLAPRGQAAVDSVAFADVCVPLGNLAGEHDITLRMTGEIVLDWFSLK